MRWPRTLAVALRPSPSVPRPPSPPVPGLPPAAASTSTPSTPAPLTSTTRSFSRKNRQAACSAAAWAELASCSGGNTARPSVGQRRVGKAAGGRTLVCLGSRWVQVCGLDGCVCRRQPLTIDPPFASPACAGAECGQVARWHAPAAQPPRRPALPRCATSRPACNEGPGAAGCEGQAPCHNRSGAATPVRQGSRASGGWQPALSGCTHLRCLLPFCRGLQLSDVVWQAAVVGGGIPAGGCHVCAAPPQRGL